MSLELFAVIISLRRRCRRQLRSCMSVPVRQKPVVGSRVPRDRCPCAARQKPMVGRVVLNAPREMPPRRLRPSWDSWIRPSLTDARPSPVRVKSVIRPWCARVVSAALCFTSTICRLWLPPCEPPRDLPPRTNATRTNTRRTPHRTRPNDERTQNEQPTNTDAPARQAPRKSADRQSPVDSPFAARISSVSCPCAVRQESVLCLCAARV